MTRRRSSPLGLELVMSVVLALVVLPLLSHGAPVQDAHHADLQKYSEGCYYNYNHYSEGDRILTNEPCLNCTCHNKMLMCYLRVCPFTKPIGHDCTVEKREDQCCPIITCPEVPVDVSHHGNQLTTSAPGTELSIPEKYGCSIDSKFYPEGAQVPSNPNKPCELCYCIRNRTSCLMQECTLHIDGCQPIYNKGSCCPVRYNCDHENELLELEDFSTTTTTVRPTPGYVLSSTTSPMVTTDCIHNNEVYADGASITGKNACEHCYCMRGDIVCAVQECEMPTLESGAKTCRALPPAAGECCPSNYVCDDDSATTEATLIEGALTTLPPKVQSNLHESVSQEDVQLQEHIDDTEVPEKTVPEPEQGSEVSGQTTVAPILGDIAEPSTEEDKKSQEEEEGILITTVSGIKETSDETTQSPIEPSTIHKTEQGLEDSHTIIGQDKEYDSTQAPIEDEIISEDKKDATTVAPAIEEGLKEEEQAVIPSKDESIASEQDESTTTSAESSSEEEAELEKTTVPSVELSKPEVPSTEEKEEEDEVKKPVASVDATTISSIQEEEDKLSSESPVIGDIKHEYPETSVEEQQPTITDASTPSKEHIEVESSSEGAQPSEEPSVGQDKIDEDIVEPSVVGTTVSPVYEMVTQGEDSEIVMPEIGDHKTEIADHEKKPKDETEASTSAPVAGVIKDDEVPKKSEEQEEEEELATSRPLPTEGVLKPEVPEVDVKIEGTTIAPAHEAVSKPGAETVESEETSTEAQDLENIITSRPTIVKGESQPDESIEGSAEGAQKPIEEDDGIPAVVQEIADTSSKPVSETIPKDDEDVSYQTTALPSKESDVEGVSEESQEEQTSSEEGEPQSTETSVSDGEKEKVIPGLPAESSIDSKVPIDQESGTTPSIAEVEEPAAEEEKIKQQPEKDLTETSTIAPAVGGAEEESVKTKPEEGLIEATTIASAIGDSEEPSSEEEGLKGQPDQGHIDSSTILPSTADSDLSSAEKEGVKGQPEESIVDSTTVASSVAGAEEPSSEENEIKGQPEQGTTISPSVAVSEEEEPIKGQPQQEISESGTVAPSGAISEEGEEEIKEQPEQGISRYTTIAPSATDDLEPSSEEHVKEKPEQGISESSTIAPSVSGVEEQTSEEEEIKGQPEQEYSTSAPSVTDAEKPTSEEEIKPKPEQGLSEYSTVAPSVVEADEASSEEEIKGQPEQDQSSTIAPSIAGAAEPSSEEEIKRQPEQEISESSTVVPSVSDDMEPSSEEEIKRQPEQEITESSTIVPSIAGSEEDEIKGQPGQDVSESTTIVPAVAGSEEPSSEEDEIKVQPEQGITDDTPVSIPSAADSKVPSAGEEEAHGLPVEGITESSTSVPTDVGSEEPSSEEEEIKVQQEQDITTVAPSVADSKIPSAGEEEIHGLPEQAVSESSTVTPTDAGAEEPSSEETIKKQPEEEISESSTSTPFVAGGEEPSSEEGEIKVQEEEDQPDATTTAPAAMDSKVPSSQEELEQKPDQHAIDSTTIASSVADSELPSSEDEKVKEQPEQVDSDSTTIAPVDSELPSEAVDDDQQSAQEDIRRTTLPPSITSDEESSEVIEAAEGSGEQTPDIIPPAIPGEGDCLVNDRTYANNASVPASNECELSCSCVSSIVVCQRVQCFEPPQPNNCILDEASADRCCPHYICGVDSFAEDQRPATPEVAEEEEIQFTTLAPTKKYPEVSTSEAEGQKPVDLVPTTVASITESGEVTSEEQAPIKPTSSKDEPAKTDLPILPDEVSTPSSVDIELPAVKPDEPMSHVKDEEESSGEGSGEEATSTEVPLITDEEIKPLPVVPSKPAHEVSGDIEEAVPPKKPSTIEESTTLKAAEEAGQESVTVTPLGQGVSGVDDSVTIDSQPESVKPAVIREEEISTESPVGGIGAPKIDESIFGTESEATTTKPIEIETGSEAPSLTSVLEGLDSAQSEETPEAPEPGSTESGEESTESEEDTKLPEVHVTTISPIATEQSTIKTIHTDLAGEIAPTESTTTIPESDYQKPELPEDLSHTKVEGESPLETETKKPIAPVSTEELDQSTESEESAEKPSEGDAPPKAPISTVLTPVEPSEKDQTAPTISDKKDVLPSDSIPSKEQSLEQSNELASEGEGKPLSSTIAPAASEEELLPGTAKPISGVESEVEKDDVASQTSAPTDKEAALPGSLAPVSEEDRDEIASQTSSPTIDEQPIAGTAKPVSEDVSDVSTDASVEKESEEEITVQTSAPAIVGKPVEEADEEKGGIAAPTIVEEPISSTIAPFSGEQDTTGQTIVEVQPLPGTTAPVLTEDSSAENEEIALQTSAPVTGEESDDKKEGPSSHTVAPVTEEESGEGIDTQTAAPAVASKPLGGSAEESEEDKEGPVSHTGAPVTEEESEEEIEAQTVGPAVASKPLEGSAEGSEEDKEGPVSHTGAPVTEEESEEEIEAQTVGPAVASKPLGGSSTPSSAEKSEEDLEGPVSHTGAPVTAEESEEEIDTQTTVPAIAGKPIPDEGTPSPIEESDDEKQGPVSQTGAPATGDESEEDIDSQTATPAIGGKPLVGAGAGAGTPSSTEEFEEGISQTSAPATEDKLDEAIDSQTTGKPVPSAGAPSSVEESDEVEEEPSSQTSSPATGEQTEEEIANQTSSPSIIDKPLPGAGTEESDELLPSQTAAPATGEQAEEEITSQTSAPVLTGESLPSTVAPVTSDESEEEIDTQTSAPTIIEEPLPGSIAPSSEDGIVSESAKPTEGKYPAATLPEDKEPSVQVTVGEEEGSDSTTLSTPVKATEEDTLGATETPAASIPVKGVEAQEEGLATTETPADSIPVKAIEKEEEDTEGASSPTQATISADDKDQSLEGTETPALSEGSGSPSAVPAIEAQEELEEGSAEVPASAGADILPSKADRGSEEELEPEISTDSSVSPIEGSGSDEKQPIDKTLLQTETPLPAGETVRPLGEEIATEEKVDQTADDEDEKPISSTDAAVIPEMVVIDEVTSQPGKPDSDDQIAVDEAVKPSVDVIATPTEAGADEKESGVTEAPTKSDESLVPSEKPVSVPVVEKESESAEEPSSEEASVQTERPISVPSISQEGDEEISVQTVKPDSIAQEIPTQTEQPTAQVSDKQEPTKDTTDKPSEDTSSQETEDEKEAVTTNAPADLAPLGLPSDSETPIAPAVPESTTASSEESEEESEQTEAPKDDVKIQTVAQFVTDRVDEQTTVLPTQDIKKEQIPEQPVTISSEETGTSSEEEPEVSVTTEKASALPSAETSDKKILSPEIPEDGQKTEEQPTESAIPPSPTTEQPIIAVEDKFDTGLPKPIATDEESSEEEEAPLSTTVHPLFPHVGLEKATSRPAAPNASDKIDDVRPVYASTTTLAPTTEQPITSAPALPQAPTYGHVPPQYPSYAEDEYTDEDETEVFGPGTCRYGGKLFVSAQQIPRDDPCDFCFCFRSDIICLQQSCPPPISGCHEEPISGFCCPRYECPVSMATVLNITTSTTTTSTTLPPHFLHHAYRGAAEKNGCHISGKSYKVGDKIDSASGPCMHCTCGGDGQMKCDPKTCSPEPMLRQMIAVVASRRR